MSSVTWLHISDWHQRVDGSQEDQKKRQEVADELLRDIERQIVTGHIDKIDFIVFSGDVAETGTEAEYEEALRVIIDPLLKFTRLPDNKLFLVPGNHDVSRQELNNLRVDLRKPCDPLTFTTERMDNLVSNLSSRAELRAPFIHFKNFARRFHADADWAYSEVISVNGVSVEIYCLNSALYCGRKDAERKTKDYGGLFVGEVQVNVLPNSDSPILGNGEEPVRIAIFHHPLSWITRKIVFICSLCASWS